MSQGEDFNIPSKEREALLTRLQDAIGDVPPHFWTACQVCHVKALRNLLRLLVLPLISFIFMLDKVIL
jgi:hypothetical protein